MKETIRWLRDRPYYRGQIEEVREEPGRRGRYEEVSMIDSVQTALSEAGIDRLYRHQARAIDAIRDGHHVALSTPTASGKSLAYTVPAFEAALEQRQCTLYVAPQVALINDQHETLSRLARGTGFGSPVTVEQYTGRLTDAERRDVRDRQPTVLLTTPDMLHYGILPHAHRLWERFFADLRYVVLDEVHEYRGVFGTQVALVIRRLNRIAERFDSHPTFICCSATVGNPREHASTVTHQPMESFRVVEDDASETGATHWVFWNPPTYADGDDTRRRSQHIETKQLFVDLVARGHQTVAFTTARQAAERYAAESAEELTARGHPDTASTVTAYQAALKDGRRSEIEDGLQTGGVRGVWSTNALELGVDIGGLDVVLLDGYPGTRLATYQQAGRAGRGTDPSLVVLVAGEDQLDQYLMAHPDEFFDRDPERAVANPENPELLPEHVTCAARENWLSPADDAHFGTTFPSIVADLESGDILERRSTRSGVRWTYAGGGSPHHDMNLRTIDEEEIQLIDRTDDRTIGRIPFDDALRDAHPGAIYHHQGVTYEVRDLDLQRGIAELAPASVDYYTKVLHEKEIAVEEELETTTLATREDVTVTFASVIMEKQITGYQRRDRKTGESYGRTPLDLPRTTLRTNGLFFTIPESVETPMRNGDGDFVGGIHAAEHGMIAMFPLELLCDRRDVGGLSTPYHQHTGQSTIFIYDGYPGGVGLTRHGFESIETLMDRTRKMIVDCPCATGCPSCVQSPHCGNANDPLDKALANELLAELVGQ